MFFFEGYFGRILYTGNFRFHDLMFRQTPLQELLKNSVDVLYLDNTYCNSKCVFPAKESALENIKEIIHKHSNGRIIIALKSCGKEELLIHLSRHFKEMIKVNEERLKVLEILKEEQNFTVNNFISSKFDVIPFSDIFQNTSCDLNSMESCVCIVPTGLFTALGYNPFENRSNIFVVPYSNHSSYNELIKFVSLVHPKSIVPINKPVSDPVSGALMDRTNVDCFQEFLDKSSMQHYHIPQSVLKVMNQSSIPKSKRLSKSVLKKARKRSEPIYVGCHDPGSNIKEMQNYKTRRESMPKNVMASTFNRTETLPRSEVNNSNPLRRISLGVTQPVNALKRCKSLDSFASVQDCGSAHQSANPANLIDLSTIQSSIISNINFYQPSNLVRCQRARLCIPEQCRTVCHSKNLNILGCFCRNYSLYSNAASVNGLMENDSPFAVKVPNTYYINRDIRSISDQVEKAPDKLIMVGRTVQCPQKRSDCNILTNHKMPVKSQSCCFNSSDSKTRAHSDVNSNEETFEPAPKALSRCQIKVDEMINELPPKKKWCNKFNNSQINSKVSSENKYNPIRRRLGTTANPVDVYLNSIAKVSTACHLSNSNYKGSTNVVPLSTITARSAKQGSCGNSMRVMYLSSQNSLNSPQSLRQPISPIDLSISKA